MPDVGALGDREGPLLPDELHVRERRDLRAEPLLERKLLLRIRQFNFGAKDVQTVTVSYPIEFFPS